MCGNTTFRGLSLLLKRNVFINMITTLVNREIWSWMESFWSTRLVIASVTVSRECITFSWRLYSALQNLKLEKSIRLTTSVNIQQGGFEQGRNWRDNWGGGVYSYCILGSAWRISFVSVIACKRNPSGRTNIWIFTPPNYHASFAPGLIIHV